MKILQTFDFFSPLAGGTATLVYSLSKALAKRGHEVTIYTTDYKLDKAYIHSLEGVGVEVHPFHIGFRLERLLVTPDMVLEAKRRLKDFDIIHIHSSRGFQNVVLHHYAKKYGIPYVMDAHGSAPRRSNKLKWLFDVVFGSRIFRDASKCIGETEVGVSEYDEFGVKQDKIVLLRLPFDTGEFSLLPPPGLFKRRYNLEGKQIILFLGRIHRLKGIDFLVKAFHRLTQFRNDVILAIVGPDYGYKPTLEELIGRLNLSDKVLFTGFLCGEEKLSALVDANIVVQTSRYEQGAGVVFEAVLCNTPIIASGNSGAGEDVKTIDAGYLVEFGNMDELRDKMQYILDNPEEAKAKTKKAKQYIETNLSMSKKVTEYEELYAKCIEENKSRRQQRRIWYKS